MHFYTNPSEVPVFFFSPAKRPLHFAKMQSNAQTAPRTGAQKSQKDDGGLRCTGAASSGRKFQVPSTSTTASTSTSRSGSGSGSRSRSPKLRRCAPAKKAEKSARKIRVASLCLCVCVCVSVAVCAPSLGQLFWLNALWAQREENRWGSLTHLQRTKKWGRARTCNALIFTFYAFFKWKMNNRKAY